MKVSILDRSKFVEAMKEPLRIEPETTALVAVDMHRGHLDPKIATMLVPKDERQRVVTSTRKLIQLARKHKIPIIHVMLHLRPIEREKSLNPFRVYAQVTNARLGRKERSWVGKTSPKGWWQPGPISKIAPAPEDYVINNKKTFSIYRGTDLEHLLKILGAETVLMMGINTNTCVLCSAFETAMRGFRLIVISDCVASAYGQDLHVFALENISRCIGWVLTLEELKEKLESGRDRSAGHVKEGGPL